MRSDSYFIYTAALEEGGYPATCPFNTGRPGLVRETVARMGMLDGADVHEREPEPASRGDLERLHAPAYLDALAAAGRGELDAAGREMGLDGPDTPVFPGMDAYAALAAGGSLTAARLILDGRAGAAFNPAGGFHHAGPALASGFCYLNDVAIAAMILAEAGRRVLVLDVDVHHGNGTQDAFYERDDVCVVSLHQDGRTLFPGTGSVEETGAGAGLGYTVNLPLPPGIDDVVYLEAFRRAILPIVVAYAPDVLVVELGMDTIRGDPLADLALTNNVHAELLPALLELDAPILATGGGGYHVANTVRGWALCWSLLSRHQEHDLALGMGGVMLENADYAGGLRDRAAPASEVHRAALRRELAPRIAHLEREVFPRYGIRPVASSGGFNAS